VLVLPAGQVHALSARVASAVLLTLLLHKGDAGEGGGRDHGRLDDRDRHLPDRTDGASIGTPLAGEHDLV
jgi:hypothetical protein